MNIYIFNLHLRCNSQNKKKHRPKLYMYCNFPGTVLVCEVIHKPPKMILHKQNLQNGCLFLQEDSSVHAIWGQKHRSVRKPEKACFNICAQSAVLTEINRDPTNPELRGFIEEDSLVMMLLL